MEEKSLVFMDECHFYQHGTRMKVWYPPKEPDPVVLQEPNKKGISVFGAVSISYGRLITQITERYNAFTFLEFLSLSHRIFPHSVFVLDYAFYHHAGIITDYAFITGTDLLFLPPYSPELNPIERVLKTINRHATHNRYFQMLNDMKSDLQSEFDRHFRTKRELKQLCVIT
ncbi:MAG: IS630 family transposase [Thermoplasmatales archaeon]